MCQSPSVLFLDASAAVIMLVLASLSKGLGNALKIRPYYRLLYLAAGISLAASLANAVLLELSSAGHQNMPYMAAAALRCAAGITAVAASLRYWHWLFSEFLKK